MLSIRGSYHIGVCHSAKVQVLHPDVQERVRIINTAACGQNTRRNHRYGLTHVTGKRFSSSRMTPKRKISATVDLGMREWWAVEMAKRKTGAKERGRGGEGRNEEVLTEN